MSPLKPGLEAWHNHTTTWPPGRTKASSPIVRFSSLFPFMAWAKVYSWHRFLPFAHGVLR